MLNVLYKNRRAGPIFPVHFKRKVVISLLESKDSSQSFDPVRVVKDKRSLRGKVECNNRHIRGYVPHGQLIIIITVLKPDWNKGEGQKGRQI